VSRFTLETLPVGARYFLFWVLVWLLGSGSGHAQKLRAAACEPKTGGLAAIVIDAETGQILYEKNSHLRRPPASTTKIMTAIVALEHGHLDDVVTISKKAAETPYSSLNFKPGERIKLRDLLYGMLLRSANDSCVAVAEHIAGSVEKFVEMMNEKAREMGCRDTHFVNPNGLHDPDHYSSAYDLALIARHAIHIPAFNEFIRTKKVKIDRSLNHEDTVVRNKSLRFLKHYLGADGIKTGYTKQAGHCFVGSATHEGWRLISVVLKSPDIAAETAALLDYGFHHFRPLFYACRNEPVQEVRVAGGKEPVKAVSVRDGFVVVPRKSRPCLERQVEIRPVEAPVEAGQSLGDLYVLLDGQKIDTVPLVADRSVDRTLIASLWHWTRSWGLLIALTVVGVRVGGTLAKNSRTRRCGFKKRF